MNTKNTTAAVLNLAISMALDVARLRRNLAESARKLAESAVEMAEIAEAGAPASGMFGFSPSLAADVLTYKTELLSVETNLRHLLVTIDRADEIAAVIDDPFGYYANEFDEEA